MILIFNIGSHKTGTKSLRRFLEKTPLKLSNNIKWYSDINYQNSIINNNNYELIKENIINDKDNIFYEDSPYNINEVYKYLNINFPNSKFILTTRDSDKWFNSFVRWCEEKKLNDGFEGVKKEKMYGAKILNENKNLIIKNYEERIINIKKYFQNTGKLLVLETDNDKINKIKLICDFLDLDYNLYKDIEYPNFTHR